MLFCLKNDEKVIIFGKCEQAAESSGENHDKYE
jgi:hypothetical protein